MWTGQARAYAAPAYHFINNTCYRKSFYDGDGGDVSDGTTSGGSKDDGSALARGSSSITLMMLLTIWTTLGASGPAAVPSVGVGERVIVGE